MDNDVEDPFSKVRASTLPPVQMLPPLVTSEDALSWRERLSAGDGYLAGIFRAGAYSSGLLFGAALLLQLLPTNQLTSVAMDHLERGGVFMLVVTPVARLIASGVMLGAKGEWRYALYAAGVLTLLGMAVGAGFRA
ncbi:MAG: DUF1634 domain-containing protein [Myxococcaceae bacterium]